jgi:hypothetical protein
MLPSSSADELIDHAFPTDKAGTAEVSCRRVFALIPQEAFQTSPEEFSSFLEGVLESEDDLDETLDRYLTPSQAIRAGTLARRVRALVPSDVLDSCDPAGFVDEIFNAFDEIEEVLSSLQGSSGGPAGTAVPAVAVVPEGVIADPQDLIRAIDRVESHTQKFDLLFRQAKHVLHRLRAYRLSRRPTGQVLAQMRQANHLPTLQYLIDFLGSIVKAASSFEKLDLPRPHIRDYLEYLYRMEDWDGMGELVHRLQAAVERYCTEEAQRPSEDPPPELDSAD